MAGKLPHYYTALPPFRELFGQGNPILTYHKLGPRPGGVRLKGLYLDAALFRRQLAELRAARFSNGTLGECAGPRVGNRVVITFDDGYVNVLRHALEPLATTGFTAVQYLVADLLGRCNEWDVALGEAAEPMLDAGQVRQWLAAGHDIGSHTRTHPYLTRIPLAQAREEIVASKRKLEDLFHRPIEHFCYPYGDWNDAVRDLVAEAGYRTACTTQPGVNDADSSPLALKRVTARYASRRLGNLFGWWRRD